MAKILILLFIAIPFLEIWLLIQSGQNLGVFNTLLLLIIMAWAGAVLVRREGVRTLMAVQKSLQQGQLPEDALLDGLLLLVAGVLMVTPGFFTDLIGFLLALPTTRPPIRRWLKQTLAERIQVTPTPGQSPPHRTVIEGEFRREPEEEP